jgi:hypothetical protein
MLRQFYKLNISFCHEHALYKYFQQINCRRKFEISFQFIITFLTRCRNFLLHTHLSSHIILEVLSYYNVLHRLIQYGEVDRNTRNKES